MYGFILTVHVVACVLLILIVLIQPSKGGGFAIFGGGGETLFSTPSGTSFLKSVTTGCAITFALTSLTLTMLGTRSGLRSVTEGAPEPPPVEAPAPAAPETPSTPPPVEPK